VKRAALLSTFCVLSACATTPSPVPDRPPSKPEPVSSAPADPQAEARRTIEEFVVLAETRRFDALHALLSKPLRDRYTAALLQRDFEAEPYAVERLNRIKAGSRLTIDGDRAALEWAPGRSLRLIREVASWKVASLE
jgi:hypothetical protein